jgi:hypothetical protein
VIKTTCTSADGQKSAGDDEAEKNVIGDEIEDSGV